MKKLLLLPLLFIAFACSSDEMDETEFVQGKTDPIIGTWYFNADEYGYWDFSNYRLTFSKKGSVLIEAYDNSANEIEFSHTAQWTNQTSSEDYTLLNYNYKFTNFDYGDGSSDGTINISFSSDYNTHYWNRGESDIYMIREN